MTLLKTVTSIGIILLKLRKVSYCKEKPSIFLTLKIKETAKFVEFFYYRIGANKQTCRLMVSDQRQPWIPAAAEASQVSFNNMNLCPADTVSDCKGYTYILTNEVINLTSKIRNV